MASLGFEPCFGVNDFSEAKYKNETETVADAILTLLFGRPGFFPSMPTLGINIQNTIYMFWDEIDTTTLKAQIAAQCSAFKSFVDDCYLEVIKSSYNKQPLLLVVIPVQIKNKVESLAIGITQDASGNILYNYTFDTSYE